MRLKFKRRDETKMQMQYVLVIILVKNFHIQFIHSG